jgi:hypothetical protein
VVYAIQQFMTSPVRPDDRELQVLLAVYSEQCDQARHYEGQHVTIMGFVVASAGALTGLATFDQALDTADAVTAAFIVVLGMFGFLASTAYYMRSFRHGKRAEKIRRSLDELFPGVRIEELRDLGDDAARRKFAPYGPLARLRLHHIWFAVNVAVVIFGVLLLWLALR